MHLFVYGTLMADDVVRAVVEKDYASASATLRGYRRVCLKDRPYPGIIPADPAAVIRGRVLHGVTEADFENLDWFEDEYTRVEEEITLAVWHPYLAESGMTGRQDGSAMTAFIYVWASGDDQVIDREWDFQAWYRGAQVDGEVDMERVYS